MSVVPSSIPEAVPPGGPAVVLLCADLATRPGRIDLGALAEALRKRPGHPAVLMPGELCSQPRLVARALVSTGAARVVVACRAGTSCHPEIAGHARRGGALLGAIEIVDMTFSPGAGSPAAGAQRLQADAEATVAAALARVQGMGSGFHLVEGPSTAVARSRRSLFSLTRPLGKPVATLVAGSCGDGGACALCAQVCPAGAIATVKEGPRVDIGRCTGCGACVTACPSNRFVVPGAALGQLASALESLSRDAAGPPGGRGVALVCRDAKRRPSLGSGWLALVLPSLEMLTLGWLLQAKAQGVGPVALVPCGPGPCELHAMVLADCYERLVEHLGAPGGLTGRVDVGAPGPAGEAAVAGRRQGPADSGRVSLEEPAATLQALKALGGKGDQSQPYRLAHAGSPVGSVSLASSGCTLCGACALACPRCALAFTSQPDGQGLECTRLSFSPVACNACGLCATACPESVLVVDRVLTSDAANGAYVGLAEAAARKCASCGEPLPLGELTARIGVRLATSHPTLAAQLGRKCPSCLVGAPRSAPGPVRSR
jgi:ferredoxin